jgi:flagellar basal-body rod protein FlgB
MQFSLDAIFSTHTRALQVGNQRMEVLAANMANADTPGYLARDIDFRAAMQSEAESSLTLRRTSDRHLPLGGLDGGPAEVLYRTALQPSLDGNTVDSDRESAAVAETAVRYEAALMFFNSKVRGLRTAIRGE